MPYIYRIDNLITNEFYYGSRYANLVEPKDDLWVTYFTSSKSVKKLINQYGKESFASLIISTYSDTDECFRKEQELIKENIDNLLCLNKQFVKDSNPVFLCKGHTEETKAKMSAANTGRVRKKGITAHNKGKPMSEEQKQKLSVAHKGKPSHKKGKPSPLKGRTAGPIKALISCYKCGLTSSKNNVFRWHNDNCKSDISV